MNENLGTHLSACENLSGKILTTKIAARNATNALLRVGCDKGGLKIMSAKLQTLHFEIRGLSHIAAAILKQEALSIGAEFATPREQILYKGEKIGLLIGNTAQLKRLSKKLKMQDFGLKGLAKILDSHLKAEFENLDSEISEFARVSEFGGISEFKFSESKNLSESKFSESAQDSESKISESTFSESKDFSEFKRAPQIMAIINATPDSFYENSRAQGSQAIAKIYELLQQGITLIDIGAASSRPGAPTQDCETEIARLKEICAEIKFQNLNAHATFSIDTYNAKTAEFALNSGFEIINDVSGFSDSEMMKICADFGATAILMHTQGTPKNMQNLANYEHLFAQIDEFFARKIENLNNFGVQKIILDVGFGFAKTTAHNLQLTAHLGHFKHFGLPILFGASRKSSIGEITAKKPQERLAGTLALHLIALQNGANILRAHDAAEHLDLLKIHNAISKV